MKTNERLKLFLKARGVKQKDVANGIGVKPTTFNAILNDNAELKADMLEDVCKFIGVTPGYFFRYKIQDGEISEAQA